MRPDRYTVKSQEALERAQRLARERGQQRIEALHLLAALLQEPGGTVAAVLEKLGVAREPLLARVEAALDRLPRVQGGTMYAGEGLRPRARGGGPRRRSACRTTTSASSTCSWPWPGADAGGPALGRRPRRRPAARARGGDAGGAAARRWPRCGAGSG